MAEINLRRTLYRFGYTSRKDAWWVKPLLTFIGLSSFVVYVTWAAFQGTPDHAAVAGDFTMTENEVGSVIKALVKNGIEVVAVHNHMVHEQPRIFFLHYWGVGNAEQLAKGLRAALDQTGIKKTRMDVSHH